MYIVLANDCRNRIIRVSCRRRRRRLRPGLTANDVTVADWHSERTSNLDCSSFIFASKVDADGE